MRKVRFGQMTHFLHEHTSKPAKPVQTRSKGSHTSTHYSSPNKNCFRNCCGSELIQVVASEPDFRSERQQQVNLPAEVGLQKVVADKLSCRSELWEGHSMWKWALWVAVWGSLWRWALWGYYIWKSVEVHFRGPCVWKSVEVSFSGYVEVCGGSR